MRTIAMPSSMEYHWGLTLLHSNPPVCGLPKDNSGGQGPPKGQRAEDQCPQEELRTPAPTVMDCLHGIHWLQAVGKTDGHHWQWPPKTVLPPVSCFQPMWSDTWTSGLMILPAMTFRALILLFNLKSTSTGETLRFCKDTTSCWFSRRPSIACDGACRSCFRTEAV